MERQIKNSSSSFFLFRQDNHFNLANLVTFGNITIGIVAMYFIFNSNFFYAAVFAWVCGMLDIIDGKIARKFSLSSEFGVQLDSFADFFSFVILPCMFLYFAIFKDFIDSSNEYYLANLILTAFAFIYYIISGVRRLITFNINTDKGSVQKYFVGMPTPLGAISLWIVYLVFVFIPNINLYFLLFVVILIAYLLNSKIKIKHI